jgi:putative FmdB family regulatory protein
VPVYEYHCTACGHRIDILHGFDDSGPIFCPACGAEGTMRKAFAPPTIVFKGSGWAKKERHSAARSKKAASASGDGEAPAAGSTSEAKQAEPGTSDKPTPAASSGTD